MSPSPRLIGLFSLAAFLSALTGCSGSDSSPTEVPNVTFAGTIVTPDGSATGALVQLTQGTATYSGTVDLSGRYELTGVPPGTYELTIDGSTVLEMDGSEAPDLATLRIAEFEVTQGAYPFGSEVLVLPEVGASLQVDLDEFRQGVVLAGTELALPDGGPALRFVQSTTLTFPEGSDGTLSLSETLPETPLTGSLPAERGSLGGFLIQPDGVTFDFAPSVLLPNRSGLAANTEGVEIVGPSASGTGVTVVATGSVDAEGRYIVVNPPEASLGDEASERSFRFALPSWAMSWGRRSQPEGTVSGRLRDGIGSSVSNAEITVKSYTTSTVTASEEFSTSVELTRPSGRVFVSGVAPGHLRSSRSIVGFANNTVNADLIFASLPNVDGRPMALSTIPADGATDVSRRIVVRTTFNELIDAGSTTYGFRLVEASDISGDSGTANSLDSRGRDDVTFAESTPGGSVVGYVPSSDLKADTEYAIIGLSSLKDAHGETFAPEPGFDPIRGSGPPAYQVIARFTTGSADPTDAIEVACTPGSPTTIERHETLQASATVTESATLFEVTNAPITWRSSAPSVATVAPNGLVSAKGAGTTTITATAVGFSDSFELTVNPPVIDRIEMTLTSDRAVVGSSIFASATAYHASNAAFDGLAQSWTSSDEAVATVDSFGKISALAPGTTTITVRPQGDSSTDTRTVTVHALSDIDGIELDSSLSAVDVGSTGPLVSSVLTGSNPVVGASVTFTSSDPAVLRVDSEGTSYTAVSEGFTVLTATAELGTTDLTQDFTVTVFPMGSSSVKALGGAGASDPAEGETVIRHDVTSGAFAESVTTDSMGVATFETLGTGTMSFSTAEVSGTTTRLRSYFGVQRSMPTISVGSVSTNPIVQLNATGAPIDTDLVAGAAGRFAFPEALVGPASPASLVGVSMGQLQTDGTVSAFMAVQNSPSDPAWDAPSDAPSAAGFLLDLDPETLNGSLQSIPVSSAALTTFPYTVSSQSHSYAAAGGVVRRSGVLFSQRFGVGSEAASGLSTLAFPSGWDAAFAVHEESSTGTRQYTSFTSVPSSAVVVNSPDLALDNVSWTNGMLSWALSGADSSAVDIGRAQVSYTTANGNRVNWTAWFAPATTSVSVPGLPASMSDVLTSFDLIEFELELFNLDSISGYSAAVAAISTANGSLEQAMLNGSLNAVSVFEDSDSGGGSGGGPTTRTLSFDISGFGTGTVTVDSGSGPAAVVDGDMVDIPDGTSVTVVATGTMGSVVATMETPSDFFFDGNPSETSTFTLTEDFTIVVQFE